MSLDPRIERGTRAMLALRRARLDAGERPLGWKVGFGAPAALELLGTDRPLVGFLTDRGLIPDGAAVRIGNWANAMLEPEIAAHIGAGGAIAGLSAAIELADVDVPPADPETILAGNIYHRRVMLGPVDTGRRDGAGIGARLLRAGEAVAETDDPAALTGDLVEVVRLTGELLAACGEELRDGDVVITGSALPPLSVGPGDTVVAELGPLGRLSVVLTGA
jgi:2-keto-4-pentenoate hydratase